VFQRTRRFAISSFLEYVKNCTFGKALTTGMTSRDLFLNAGSRRQHAMMPRWIGFALAALLSVTHVASGAGTMDPPLQYQIDHWSIKHGLPHNSINALLQSRDGYLWIGTLRGVTRFDGTEFRSIEGFARRVSRLRNILALAEGNDGSLWIGTDGAGVVRYFKDSLTLFDTRSGFPSDVVQCLAVDAGGRVLVGTSGQGMHVLSPPFLPNASKPVAGLEGLDVRDISIDKHGRVWVATVGAGLLTVREVGGLFSAHSEGVPFKQVYGVIANKGDSVVVSTQAGVFALHGKQRKLLVPPMPQQQDFFVSICRGTDGAVWAGSYLYGLVRHQLGESPSSNLHISRKDGLAGDYIGCMLEDREGSIWIGTEYGLDRLSKATVQNIGQREGIPFESITGCAEDSAGGVWIATAESGLFHMKDGRLVQKLDTHHGLPDGINRSICMTRNGELLIASESNGVYALRDASLRQWPKATPGGAPYAILQVADGSIWVGTDGGLRHFSEAGAQITDTISRVRLRGVRALMEDRHKCLWVGTETGLVRILNGQMTRFTTTDGLPDNYINALGEDSLGDVWIGTSAGLARLRDGAFHVFRTAQGLADGLITCIVEDHRGYLWLGSPVGIMRIPLEDFARVENRELPRLRVQLLGFADGMESIECSSIGVPSGFRRKNGEIWIVTTAGIGVINPARLYLVNADFPVIIENAVSGQQRRFFKGPVELPPGDNNLTVNFSHPVFRTARQSEFHYQLEGFEKDWVDAGTRQSAIYTNLPPGSYTFKVMVLGGNGGTPVIATLPIVVTPHFYERPEFRYGLAILIVILFLAGHQFRTRHMLLQQRELERVVAERTSSLQQEVVERTRAEQELRAREEELNTSLNEKVALIKEIHHRVKNNLTIVTSLLSLQGSSATDRRVKEVLLDAENRVRSMAAIHELLYQSRNLAAIDFGPYIESLVSRLVIAYGLPGVSYGVNVQSIHLEVGKAIPCALIINELVTNSLKYAFPKGGPGRITVSLERVNEEEFRLVVSDDGVGIDAPPDLDAPATMGLNLVNILSSQLGGHYTMTFHPGVQCTVTFPQDQAL
jgi:two-component sensor histidine kinase/ligand-binding sensor domain-containing protein